MTLMTLELMDFLSHAYIHFVVSSHYHLRISNAFGRTTPMSVS